MNSNQCIFVIAADIAGERKDIFICIYTENIITESANATEWGFSKISGEIKKGHAHKQTMGRLF